jgi:hypothetical protein
MNEQPLSLQDAIDYCDELYPHIDVKASLTERQRQGRLMTISGCQKWLEAERRARPTKRQRDKYDNTPPAPGFSEWWRNHPHSGYSDKQQPEFGNSTTPHWGILPSMAWMVLRYREEWEASQQMKEAA